MNLPRGVFLGVVLASAGLARAEQPVISISVDRVQVDAVVTDDSGQLVTDLGPKDFTILESGQSREVANVAYVDSTTPTSPEHRRTPRLMVVIFDDLGISLSSAAGASSALQQFARVPFEPGDQVGLVRTGQDKSSYKFFVSSEDLLAATSKLRGHAANMSGEDVEEWAVSGVARSTLDRRVRTIVGTIDGLRGLPGRKAVVLVSEGFPVSQGGFRRIDRRTVYDSLFYDQSLYPDDYTQTLRLITEVANRASAVVYVIDPRGVVGGLPPGQDSLQDLADKTGGLAVMNRNNLVGGFQRIVADQGGYYLVGFEPGPSTFDWKSGRPAFHPVKVTVNRPGLKIRSRSGFYGITDREVASRVPRAPSMD
jgi:VWFA-related protein